MDAYVTIRYRLNNVCDPGDLGADMTLEQMVHLLLEEDTLDGLANSLEVIAIEEAAPMTAAGTGGEVGAP